MSSKAELKQLYPKGAAPPRSYTAWFDWAEAQLAHGLKQTQCPECGRWVFPQEARNHPRRGSSRSLDAEIRRCKPKKG